MYNKVLIIDDDEISIFLTKTILEVAHFARVFVGFQSAHDALTELVSALRNDCTQQLPDIIFLDLNMPFMSGWELLDSLLPYENVLRNKCLIYILTSSVDASEIEKAAKYKLVTGFLQKPLDEHAIASISKKV
ncbi:CheY-like chemotaxis protein [Pontibacter aydingkolensis]|uniref:Response regulator n=1 Tax=Pontibacter aydingkolensis TaxID=1911536 RepID=A0ABS7CY98_9BACT|nr:response regulator [Pontibacter aydingkolensis]MBW7468661.1 response regulator [Pontibacter aydingkolensis]